MSLLGKLKAARAQLDAHHDDPWHKKVEAAVCIRMPSAPPRYSICFACQPPPARRAGWLL
jgi:hypothetical protein